MNVTSVGAAVLMLASACAHAQASDTPDASAAASAPQSLGSATPQQLARLTDAAQLLRSGHAQEAITNDLDSVIAEFEAKYANSGKRMYCSHSEAETRAYLGWALRDRQPSSVIDSAWADAYYMRGFAYLSLGDNARAQASYQGSLKLSPLNAHYIVELGHAVQRQKDWPQAMHLYQSALENAPLYSPPGARDFDMITALQGIGYVDVELGKLDDAEAAYRRSLEIDPHNAGSLNELAYVQGLRSKQTGH